jgi:hypothetical protein
MPRFRDPGSYERLRDAVSFRVSDAERAFLEKIAKERNCGIAQAGRAIIDEAMKSREIEG